MIFWRELTADELKLSELVSEAHWKSACRENLSTVAFRNALYGSGDYTKAVTAALATLGDIHGPVAQAVELLSGDAVLEANVLLAQGKRVPGFGNSFIKTDDPIWEMVRQWFQAFRKPLWDEVLAVKKTLWDHGHELYPNPACYTACTAITLGMPAKLSPYLFIAARLPAWTAMAMEE